MFLRLLLVEGNCRKEVEPFLPGNMLTKQGCLDQSDYSHKVHRTRLVSN